MIIPNCPNRKLDCSDILNASFATSAKSGEPVFLDGYYAIKKPLGASGATVLGTAHNFTDNWSAEYGASVGPTRLDIQHTGNAVLAGQRNNRSATLKNLGIVFLSSNPGTGIVADKGSVLDTIHIDAAWVGISMAGAQHRWHNIHIRSPRMYGLNVIGNAEDSRINNFYIEGKQHKDYVSPGDPPLRCACGIHNLPISSHFTGFTLIEKCGVGINTGVGTINTTFDNLHIEVDNIGLVLGPPRTDGAWLKELFISRLHLQACAKDCVGIRRNAAQALRVGVQVESVAPGGAWKTK